MDDADLQRLFRDLRGVHAQLDQAVNVRLRREAGLAVTVFAAMQVISEVQGCRVREVAADLELSIGGASKLVDRLERAGYARRVPNPADRRSSLLELTEIGQGVYADVAAAVTHELARHLGRRISAPQIGELSAILGHLRLPADARLPQSGATLAP